MPVPTLQWLREYLNRSLVDVTADYEDHFDALYLDDLHRKPEVVAKRLAEIGKGMPK